MGFKKAVLALVLIFLGLAVFYGYLAHRAYAEAMEYIKDVTIPQGLELLIRSSTLVLWYAVFTMFSLLFFCLGLYVLIRFILDS